VVGSKPKPRDPGTGRGVKSALPPRKNGGRPVVKGDGSNGASKNFQPAKGIKTAAAKNHAGKGGKGGGGKSGYYGGIGKYKGVKMGTVNSLVNGIINKENDDLRTQIRDVNRSTRDQNSQANALYNRGKGDLAYTHGETADFLKSIQGQSQQGYNNMANQQQAAAQALQAQLGNTYSGALTSGQEELNRLGIGNAGNFGGMIQDAANNQALAGQASNNIAGAMAMTQNNSNNYMSGLSGMNQGSYLQGLGEALNARNDQIATNNQNRLNQINKVHEAMTNNAGQRRDVFMQLLNQLSQTGWSQYLQAKQAHIIGGKPHHKHK
jgi:hypothetical protein